MRIAPVCASVTEKLAGRVVVEADAMHAARAMARSAILECVREASGLQEPRQRRHHDSAGTTTAAGSGLQQLGCRQEGSLCVCGDVIGTIITTTKFLALPTANWFSGYPHTSNIVHHGFNSRLAGTPLVRSSFLSSFLSSLLPSSLFPL